MITRIKIDGFKSLVNTEVYFGPFTCIVGQNAVGKSNLFDAISFLSNLVRNDHNSILEVARSVRGIDPKHADIRDIFFRKGDRSVNEILFEVDMIVSESAIDDLGQEAKAGITSLRYKLKIRFVEQKLQIVEEDLSPITLTEARKHILFSTSIKWKNSFIKGRRASPYISTKSGKTKLHSDSAEGKRGGRTTESVTALMKRTLLSTVTAESPTAFLAKYEMQNWEMFQLEPSAMREPNSSFDVDGAKVGLNGAELPATLYRLAHSENDENAVNDFYQDLANQLYGLVEEVRGVRVLHDKTKDTLILEVQFKDGLWIPAQSLSDGTLRFLALAIKNIDTNNHSVFCLEEPENGISPKKIEAIVKLVQDMASKETDTSLRQVIINTHSPLVAKYTDTADMLYARSTEEIHAKFGRIKTTQFYAINAENNTWRTKIDGQRMETFDEILKHLEPFIDTNEGSFQAAAVAHKKKKSSYFEDKNQTKLIFQE